LDWRVATALLPINARVMELGRLVACGVPLHGHQPRETDMTSNAKLTVAVVVVIGLFAALAYYYYATDAKTVVDTTLPATTQQTQ
jgi:hypothetical protein